MQFCRYFSLLSWQNTLNRSVVFLLQNESKSKRPKSADAKKEKDDSNSDAEEGIHSGKPEVNSKQYAQSAKPSEPPKDYIHVRARRGQATDSHSLAERVNSLHIKIA